jgi:hypothetical protein
MNDFVSVYGVKVWPDRPTRIHSFRRVSGAEDPSAQPTAGRRRRGAGDRRWQNVGGIVRWSSAEAVASSKSASIKPVDKALAGNALTRHLQATRISGDRIEITWHHQCTQASKEVFAEKNGEAAAAEPLGRYPWEGSGPVHCVGSWWRARQRRPLEESGPSNPTRAERPTARYSQQCTMCMGGRSR